MAPSFNTWSIYSNDGSTLIGTVRLLANSSEYIVVENGIQNTSGDVTWTYDGTIIGLATTPNATTPTYAVGDRFLNSNYTFYIIEDADTVYSIRESTLKAIAESIREKTGETRKIKPTEFPVKILTIESTESGTEIDALIDEINGEVINGKVVTFKDLDDSILCQVSVVPGYNCTDPTVTGLIEKPVKASTETQVFTFNGWSLTKGGEADSAALKNVTEDRTVYPAFAATTRLYTVRFFDGDTLLTTKTVEFGGSTEHTYGKIGYYFNGWEPEPVNITEDTDCYAQMVQANFSADDWSTIVAAAENGTAADKYKVGDTREMSLTINGKTETIIVQIAGFNVDTLENGGKAGMTIIAKNPLADPVVWNGTNYPVTEGGNTYAYTRYGFEGADLRAYLDNTVAAEFPVVLQNALKKVQKSYDYYNGINSSNKKTGAWKMWIPSAYEVTGLYTYSDGNGYRYSALYKSDDARIATLYNSGEAVKWWTTTVGGGGSDSARYITASGGVGTSTGSVYVAGAYVIFGFCI